MGALSLFTNSSSYGTVFNSTATGQQSQTVSTQDATQSTDSSANQDTVKLSTKAQAQLLYKQGQSVSAIASALGTDTKTVDDYLNIAVDEALQKAIEEASKLSA